MTYRSGLYVGEVVHARLKPVLHKFRYRVFALALDVDEIDDLDRSMRLFARNRRSVASLFDGDVGVPSAMPVADKIRGLLGELELSAFGARVVLLTYPRLWGYVFNPLSVYFCYDAGGQLGVTVYEVTNTFGERRSYVLRAGAPQRCAKAMYVSPFTHTPARYGFHGIAPGERVVVGVTLSENDAPILRTHFAGERRALTDVALARAVATHPLMTFKVTAAIHIEAARLWWKGVPLVERHRSQPYSYELVGAAPGEPSHAA